MFSELRRWFKKVIGEDKYTVVQGDTLWRIALHGTGDGARWTDLIAANPDKHWDNMHTIINPGEEINLPDGWL